MSQYELIQLADRGSLAKRAAETIAQVIDLTLAEQDRVQIALSGGSTPEATYRLLGQEHLAWDRVDLLMGDERYVPADDPLSNARMVRGSLMAEGPGQHACFHPVPTDGADVTSDVARFNSSLEHICGSTPPQFDLILLGLGDDGHTASLFPGTAATKNTTWRAAQRTGGVRVMRGIPLPSPTVTQRSRTWVAAVPGNREAV